MGARTGIVELGKQACFEWLGSHGIDFSILCTITEMKNILKGINCRITKAEKQVSELEDRKGTITSAEYNKEKRVRRN